MKEKSVVKILGVLDKVSAGSMHRVRLPLNFLKDKKVQYNREECSIQVDFLEFIETDKKITEDFFRVYDVIYFHWILYNHVSDLDIWSKKHNCKLIFDCDDAPPAFNHPVYIGNDIRDYIRTWLIKGSVVCDAVVVTNELLAAEFLKFNKFVQISPNFLPNSGQFEYKPRVRNKEDKLNIGICGSYSHYKDWESLRGVLKKIAGDYEIQNKCRFVIAGYDESSKLWRDIKSWFDVNSKMELVTYPFENLDNYMSLYEKVDILLTPLEDTLFNQGKSSLKIEESARRDCVVIGSRLFTEKHNTTILVADKAADYYNWIKWLLKDDNFDKYSVSLSEANRKVSNFDERVENTRAMIEFLVSDQYSIIKEERQPENVSLFGIIYKEGQYTPFIEYNNSHINSLEQKSWRFEWNPVIDILDNYEDLQEYTGIFSWKVCQKTGISQSILCSLLKEYAPENYDVINLCQPLGMNYMEFSEHSHPGLTSLVKKVCEKLGLEYYQNVKHTIYSNQMICRTNIYKNYVDNIVKPALELLEGELWEEANLNSEYKSGLSPEELFEKTGMNYYNRVTFVIERLFSQYLMNKDLKVKNIF